MSDLKIHTYPMNIGDWRSGTRKLSLTEKGAYKELCDQYYQDNGVDWDETECFRICSALTPEEQIAVQNVLAKKFHKTGNGYTHTGMETRIAAITKTSERFHERAKKAANAMHKAKSGDASSTATSSASGTATSGATSSASSKRQARLRACHPESINHKEELGAHTPNSSVGRKRTKKPPKPVAPPPSAACPVPPELRKLIADDPAFGPEWCVSYLDPCRLDGDRLMARFHSAVAQLRRCPHLAPFEIVPPA